MKPLLALAARKGVSATILAYGQTGSGKTHTIMGGGRDSDDSGFVPRLVDDLHQRYGAPNINISACYVQGSYSTNFLKILEKDI